MDMEIPSITSGLGNSKPHLWIGNPKHQFRTRKYPKFHWQVLQHRVICLQWSLTEAWTWAKFPMVHFPSSIATPQHTRQNDCNKVSFNTYIPIQVLWLWTNPLTPQCKGVNMFTYWCKPGLSVSPALQTCQIGTLGVHASSSDYRPNFLPANRKCI